MIFVNQVLYNIGMVKFITDIIGSEVLVQRERLRVGKIANVILSPDNGDLIGILISTHTKKDDAVPASEIKGFGDGFVLINEASSIDSPDEIVRIKQILDKKIKIIGQKVYTESGQRLGKCVNATLSLKYQKLDKIYVTPKAIVAILASDLMIPAKKIVEITKERIIVTDEFVRVPAPTLAASASPAFD